VRQDYRAPFHNPSIQYGLNVGDSGSYWWSRISGLK
jgi:hypothetical protein